MKTITEKLTTARFVHFPEHVLMQVLSGNVNRFVDLYDVCFPNGYGNIGDLIFVKERMYMKDGELIYGNLENVEYQGLKRVSYKLMKIDQARYWLEIKDVQLKRLNDVVNERKYFLFEQLNYDLKKLFNDNPMVWEVYFEVIKLYKEKP